MAAPAPVATERWWTADTVAVVTGANKGIGYQIALQLAAAGVLVIATARDEARGAEAVAKLLEATAPSGRVQFHQLDVADPASVERFAGWLEKTHQGVTILVNNAGIAFLPGTELIGSHAQQTMDINFTGTVQVCERLKPLLLKDARIVNVSSSMHKSSQLTDSTLLSRATGEATTTAQLQQLGKEFVQATFDGKLEADGWQKPGFLYPIYSLSKLFCSQYTRVLARELPTVMVNACCPGYCATDLNSFAGGSTAAVGADTPVWLALRPPSSFVTGEFFNERTSKPF